MPPAEPAEEPVGYGAITVRRFRESDSDAMAALTAETPEAAAWTRTSYARFPAQPGAVALVAEEQGSVVGFLIGRALEQQAEVLNLAVGWSKRRRGCATLLLAAAQEAFRERGAKSVYLEVRQSNTGAIAFYAKHGFNPGGLRPGYYRSPDEPAVTMLKNLPSEKLAG